MSVSEKTIIECSESLLFSLNEKQLQKLTTEFGKILMQFEQVNKIDTTGLEPTNYPVAISTHQLREDIVIAANNVDQLMKCPAQIENQLVKVY